MKHIINKVNNMNKQFFYDLEAQFPLFPVKNIYHKMLDKYPKMKENDYRTALEGLFCWFEICKGHPKKLKPMPSVSIDDMWHFFILHTKQYSIFCEEFFGYFLHHSPDDVAVSKNETNEEIKILSLWILACEMEYLNPIDTNSKPSLFYSDVLFGIKSSSYLKTFSTNILKHKNSYKKSSSSLLNKIVNHFSKNKTSNVKEDETSFNGYFTTAIASIGLYTVLSEPAYTDVGLEAEMAARKKEAASGGHSSNSGSSDSGMPYYAFGDSSSSNNNSKHHNTDHHSSHSSTKCSSHSDSSSDSSSSSSHSSSCGSSCGGGCG